MRYLQITTPLFTLKITAGRAAALFAAVALGGAAAFFSGGERPQKTQSDWWDTISDDGAKEKFDAKFSIRLCSARHEAVAVVFNVGSDREITQTQRLKFISGIDSTQEWLQVMFNAIAVDPGPENISVQAGIYQKALNENKYAKTNGDVRYEVKYVLNPQDHAPCGQPGAVLPAAPI